MRTAQLVSDWLGLSVSCQKRTNAPRQKHSYSIISSARASSVGGTREAKHPGGLEIDHQLVLVRPLYGQVAWFNPRDRRLVRSLVDGGQPRAVIGDVDCEQAWSLRVCSCRFDLKPREIVVLFHGHHAFVWGAYLSL